MYFQNFAGHINFNLLFERLINTGIAPLQNTFTAPHPRPLSERYHNKCYHDGNQILTVVR